MYSKILQLSKIIDSSDKIGHSSDKNLWSNEINKMLPYEVFFPPPPPRGKFMEIQGKNY